MIDDGVNINDCRGANRFIWAERVRDAENPPPPPPPPVPKGKAIRGPLPQNEPGLSNRQRASRQKRAIRSNTKL